MDKDKIDILIAEFLNGSITNEGKDKLKQLIEIGEIDLIDFKSDEKIYKDLLMLSVPEPSSSLDQNFYAMLDEEIQSQESAQNQWLYSLITKIKEYVTLPRMAYALSLILVGAFIGTFTQNEHSEIQELTTQVQQMQEVMMLSMLEKPSANDRLKAVNISSEIVDADDRIIDALLQTLNNDPNVNVRQQAIYALARWSDAPDVRMGLIMSISQQDNPLVLIALADVMVGLEEKRSLEEFKKLIEEKSFDPFVKQKIESSIAALS